MSGTKKLPIVNLKFEQQKSESNSRRAVEVSENKNKPDTVCFLSYLLAIIAIDHWLERTKYPIEVREALKFLGLRIKTKRLSEQKEFDIIDFLQQFVLETMDDLHQELETKMELYEIYQVDTNDLPSEGFKIVEHYLNKKTSKAPQKYHFTLKTNYQNLLKELENRFEKLASFWEEASIQNSLDFLQEIGDFLHKSELEYQQEREKYLNKENASFRAYKRFMSAIEYKKHSDNFSNLQNNIFIAKQSMLNSYKFKIEAETYALASRALNSLIITNQMYIKSLQEYHDFLTKIKANFLTLAGIIEEDYLFLPLVVDKINNHLDLDNLQKKVKTKLGHSLHTSSHYTVVTMDEVQNVLIEEVRPIAKKICSDTYHQLANEVDRFE